MVLPTKAIEYEKNIENIKKLLEKLEINYKNTDNYILAFIHRSLVNERPDYAPEHNERLEFLWDAVLELAITSNLYNNFPKKPEWELTDIRSSIVRGKNLALITRELWLQEYLLLGKWEEKTWWRDNDYLLANLLEAFIWAMNLDIWYQETKKFIDNHIYITLPETLEWDSIKDYKSLVQEYSQAKYSITPNYETLSEEWPDHNKIFKSGMYLWALLIDTGTWKSKKKSQETAAENAYNNRENWDIKDVLTYL